MIKLVFSLSLLLVALAITVPAFAVSEAGRHGDCTLCHGTADDETDGSLVEAEPALCQQCHPGQNEHAILVPASVRAGSLPLAGGLMTCITCHDPHASTPLQLRLPPRKLCVACHEK